MKVLLEALWAQRSEVWKWVTGILIAITMFGGMTMFPVKLVSIQRPVLSSFLTRMDDYMYDRYWNQLEPNARVFSPDLSRVTTVFGRPGKGGLTRFSFTEEFEELANVPRPAILRAAGYEYMYIDQSYFASLPEVLQQEFMGGGSVKIIDEAKNEFGGFRRLFDIKDCRE